MKRCGRVTCGLLNAVRTMLKLPTPGCHPTTSASHCGTLRIREAVRIRPDYPESHNKPGHAHAGHRSDDRALYHYGEALKLAPESLDIRYNLALFAQERERLEQPRTRIAAPRA